MKLLTKEIEARFPRLYTNDNKEPKDVKIIAKFFDPCSNWTWYATEYDKKECIFFGYVIGFFNELGYFSLTELESYKGKMGLGIERDIHFGYNHTLEEVMNSERSL